MNFSLKNSYLQLDKFSEIPGLVHGFSTRIFGSMNRAHPESEKSLTIFAKTMKISTGNIVRMEQTHSNSIRWVTQKNRGSEINKVDGLLTEEKNTFLSVLSADCIPVLLFDKTKKITGAVHAGWRGVYNETLLYAVKELKLKGTNPDDLIIGIGPCIRYCCYDISGERYELFSKKFGKSGNFFRKTNNKIFLNLPSIAKYQLTSEGIPEKNIEDCGKCTFDNNDLFFSFRKEGQKFGKFIGIIGLRF